jgi:hypothetical protein
MATFHVVDLPVCGGRVWCHTRLTHEEASRLADAELEMLPENLSGDDLGRMVAARDRQRKSGKVSNVIDLPKGMMAIAKDAQRRQRLYDEALVDVVVHHMADVQSRDGAPIEKKDELGQLDADDWSALVAGAKVAVEAGRADPRPGSPTSSDGPSPTAVPDSPQLRPAI